MVRHVLAIYRATPAGASAVREAGVIAGEHGAQLTVAVEDVPRGLRGFHSISPGHWEALARAALDDPRRTGSAPVAPTVHLAVIQGGGPRAIAAAAEHMRCDVVVVPVARLTLRGGLAGALRRRIDASVVGVRSR
jgi:hypothetical protein